MKEKTLPDAGLLISEVVEYLRNLGFDTTAQQLRKYEIAGLYKAVQRDNKYRVYTSSVCDRVLTIYELKLIGFSPRKIRTFFDLEKKILNSPLFISRQIEDKKTKDVGWARELSPDVDVNDTRYQRLLMDIRQFNSMCDDIQNKVDKLRHTLDGTKIRFEQQKRHIERLGKV